jgi:tRNA/tmRNA/rRNA uracil-C5-methylase (TrmA/RlmC/RlmD family)
VSPNAGDKLTVTIGDIAFGGEGVARVDDFVVFVPFVLLGETVEIEMVEVKQRFGRGRLLRVAIPSTRRVQPECRYFGECGGCQYQHIAYPEQLGIKHKQLCDIFQRIGNLDQSKIAAVIPCPEPYHYRNRIMIRSQWDKFKQGLNIGYIRAGNRLVVDIEECKIAETALNEEIQHVRRNPPPKGGLKVVLRIPPPGWEVPKDSFFQNNFFLLPKLVEVVRNFFADSGSSHLIDVYCGVGFFSIELADQAESYLGVELDALAIKAARKNAVKHRRTNGEFIAGAAEVLLPSLLTRFTPEKTTVLLDPPRAGLRPEMLEVLQRVRPAQIVYVSCHPATIARDLNILCSTDVFKVAQVVPLDMFPQTTHIECVADIRLTDNSEEAANPIN